MPQIRLKLGEERIVSMAPPEVRAWGPWQFPCLYKGEEGAIILSFHVAADDYASYGSKPGLYRSLDSGKSWEPCAARGGLLADGTRIRPANIPALPVSELSLPEPAARCRFCYTKDAVFYDMQEVAGDLKRWYRYAVRGGEEKLEEIEVSAPGYLMRASDGLLIRPFFYMPYFYRRPDGAVMAVSYHPLRRKDGEETYFDALFFESRDEGRSFRLLSSIPFHPPYEGLEDGENCQGWLEPSLCFTGERDAFTLLRTTCRLGVRPLFISWSHDGCKSWSRPELFDSLGVFPQCVQLANGVTLAGYGRPGFFLRALYEGKWGERQALVKPGELSRDTCSYCALLPIGPDRALVAYSRFNVLDGQGRPCKAIICRAVTASIE